MTVNKVQAQAMHELNNQLLEVTSSINDGTTPPAPRKEDGSDLASLGVEAIIKCCDAAARAIEASGKEILEVAQQHMKSCQDVASEIRRVADDMSKETLRIARKARAAAMGAQKIAEEFHLNLKSDDEAPPQRT